MSSLATPKAIFVQVLLGLALLVSLLGLDTILAAPSSGANLDQVRNGSAGSPLTSGKWVNGNAGSSNAHYVEGFSVPYRVVMTGLRPEDGPVTIAFGYDTQLDGKHAIDYLTRFDRLQPHDPIFGHPPEAIDPTTGIFSEPNIETHTAQIPAPSSLGSSVPGYPTASFNNLPADERVMTLYNGTFADDNPIKYVYEGDLSAAKSETIVSITFTPLSDTAILAWGGHIALAVEVVEKQFSGWGTGNSASGINGSPYHMRLEDWSLGGLGNQDRSLKAGAVVTPGIIVIEKQTEPSDDESFEFTLVHGEVSLSEFSLADGDLFNSGGVRPGTGYVATEAVSDDWVLTTTCSNSSTVENIQVNEGEFVICTFTNTHKPRLTVTKVVDNDHGGIMVVGNFRLFVDGNAVTSGTAYTYSADTHVVSEADTYGYTPSFSGACDVNGLVTLNLADVKTCTITNYDIAPRLTVITRVINDDGGTAPPGDFLASITANKPSVASLPGNISGTTITLNAGDYEVSPEEASGYRISTRDCIGTISVGDHLTCTITYDDVAPFLTVTKVVVNDHGGTMGVTDFHLFVDTAEVTSGVAIAYPVGTYVVSEAHTPDYAASFSGDCDVNGSVTLDLGDFKTCTITNNDNAPMLTVTKVVINDDGGTLVVNDFRLFVDGSAVTSGTAYAYSAGTYVVSEADTPGYTASFSGDCDATGSVTLDLAESKSCIITNNDIGPTLTVIKLVINDNGGTLQPVDFSLFVDGNAVTSGTAYPYSAGTYVVSEADTPGYTASFSGDCDATGSVTLDLAESKTCTITNNDNAPTLTVTKVVINDDGGTMVVEDFLLFVDGSAVTSGTAYAYSAGPYVVSEADTPGYTASFSGDCDATGSVTLNLGESKTCTITNNDNAPMFTVTKVVINDDGGTMVVEDFSLFVDGNAVTSGTAYPYSAGTYVVSEADTPGYTASFSGDCDVNGSVTLNLADVKTCTITNDDIAPMLTVIKVVVNDDGGTMVVEDFPLFVDGNAVETGVSNAYLAGTYTVSETSKFGYASSFSGHCDVNGSVTLNLADVKTCTITNDDTAPTLTIVKVLVPSNDAGKFDLEIDGVVAGTGANSGDGGSTGAVGVKAGQYVVGESGAVGTELAEYSAVISGECAPDGTITLMVGENKTCTITNTKLGQIIIDKVTDPSPDVTYTSFPFALTGQPAFSLTNGDPAYNTGYSLAPDANYVATQSEVNGWEAAAPVCTSALGTSSIQTALLTADILLAPGDTVTCVFNNVKQFTLIVLICEEATNKLYASQVTVIGSGVTTTLGPSGALLDLGIADELLCSLAGARYEDLHYGEINVYADIPE